MQPFPLEGMLRFCQGILNLLLIETDYGLIVNDDYGHTPLVC